MYQRRIGFVIREFYIKDVIVFALSDIPQFFCLNYQTHCISIGLGVSKITFLVIFGLYAEVEIFL